jgi:hypothetical protein
MKALLELFVGKGGGSLSIDQNLVLANPCGSREPRLLNCTCQLIYFERIT